MKTLAYCCTSGDSFIAPILEHLSRRFVVSNLVGPDETGNPTIDWQPPADLIWCEWADSTTAMVTNAPKKAPIIVRVHSYEVLDTPFLSQIRWKAVDAVVYVAEHVQLYAETKCPAMAKVPIRKVIPNGLDLERWHHHPRQSYGHKVAWVGGISHKKGAMLFAHAARFILDSFRDAEFHIAGAFEEERSQAYLSWAIENMGLTHAVRTWGKIDPAEMPDWFAHMDYVLSTSPWESFQYAVAEGVATGCLPLVHNWPGAENVYPWGVWSNVRELIPMMKPYNPQKRSEECRRVIATRYDLRDRLADVDDLVSSVLSAGRLNRPTIGAAMVAKGNGASGIRNALRGILGGVDEAVVLLDVRHGREALELATEFPDVRFEEGVPLWKDNHIHFAEARNKAESMLSTDWCVVIDADETIENAFLLPRMVYETKLSDQPYDVICLPVECWTDGGMAEDSSDVRCYRRNVGIRYKYPIHNQVVGFSCAFGVGDIKIRSSYEGVGALQHRFDRAVPPLLLLWDEAVANDDAETKAHAAFFLARMHAVIRDNEGILKWGLECRALCPGEKARCAFWFWGAQALMMLPGHGKDEVRIWLDEALRYHPTHTDLLHFRMSLDALDWALSVNDPMSVTVSSHTRQLVPRLREAASLLKMPISIDVK